jgi:hypothetical protein
MSATLTIRDATLSGETLNEWSLDFLSERITLKELIRGRVYQEVQDHNLRRPPRFQGLIQPADDERALNGPKPARAPQIDWRRQFQRALEAFGKKQILVFVNDRHLEDLEEEIEIKPGTEVSFLRLTMLTGG